MIKTNGKVQKFKRKSGTAYALKIIHNYWSKERQQGTNKIIKPVLYIPANQNINDGLYRVFAWNKINKVLDNLILQKVVSPADADNAKRNFAKLIAQIKKPLPIAATKPDPLSKYRHILKS